MAAVRRADVTWNGDLASGKGNVSGASSGVVQEPRGQLAASI